MSTPAPTGPRVEAVEVYWRPGCMYCTVLRRGLRRRGIATVETNIWAEKSAAARVRMATGGSETVPTVFLGEDALVAPDADQVAAVLARRAPHLLPPAGWTPPPGPIARLLRRLPVGLRRRRPGRSAADRSTPTTSKDAS